MKAVSLLDKHGYRKFGLILALFIVCVFGLFQPWMAERTMPLWPWIVAAGFVIWSLAFPVSLQIVYRPWMVVGHYLGLVNTNIILTLVFYVIFTPVALFFNVTGKDPMERKWKGGATETYWITSSKQPGNSLENIF